MKTTSTLQMIIRIVGSIQLILGIIVWVAIADALIPVHILLGLLITIALLALTYQAYRAGVSIGLVALAAVWELLLPVWGMGQEHIFPESYFWVSQILHVLCGIGAIGLAEILPVQMRKKDALLSHA